MNRTQTREVGLGNKATEGLILVVEPDQGLFSIREMLLQNEQYPVTAATGYLSVSKLYPSCEFRLAILNTCLGEAAVIDIAEFVRRRWPRTWILLVGNLRQRIDDHLYDDSISDDFHAQQLVDVVRRTVAGGSESTWLTEKKRVNANRKATLLCLAIPPRTRRDMSDPARPDFSHAPAYADEHHVLIKSTCKKCGESALVSIVDDSVKKWELTHRCAVPFTKAEDRIERDA
jgi:hypothetical protein